MILIRMQGFIVVFFFNDTATTEIYTVSDTLSLHDALPISVVPLDGEAVGPVRAQRHRHQRSEEHTSELQSPDTISYAVFCLKKKKQIHILIFISFFFYNNNIDELIKAI